MFYDCGIPLEKVKFYPREGTSLLLNKYCWGGVICANREAGKFIPEDISPLEAEKYLEIIKKMTQQWQRLQEENVSDHIYYDTDDSKEAKILKILRGGKYPAEDAVSCNEARSMFINGIKNLLSKYGISKRVTSMLYGDTKEYAVLCNYVFYHLFDEEDKDEKIGIMSPKRGSVAMMYTLNPKSYDWAIHALSDLSFSSDIFTDIHIPKLEFIKAKDVEKAVCLDHFWDTGCFLDRASHYFEEIAYKKTAGE